MKPVLISSKRIDIAEAIIDVVKSAEEVILSVYASTEKLNIERKEDNSPVTQADTQAHDIIYAALSKLTPTWPILSEEEFIPSFSERSLWPIYWLIDPLDGTKEFIQRTGEFTINIALIENGRPTIGIIHVPLEHNTYIGVVGDGAWINHCDNQHRLQPQSSFHSKKESEAIEKKPDIIEKEPETIKVLTSSRHSGLVLERCMSMLRKHFVVEHLKIGSALKFCRLAEGMGNIYPRFSPCCEWDTAAGQALLEATGGQLLGMDFIPLLYNQSESLINPHFYALSASNSNLVSLLKDQEGFIHKNSST